MTHDLSSLLRSWRELAVLAETGHVTDTAAILGVAQPTLSRSLARVSAEVGAPLVRRHGRGIVLTRYGEQLAAVAERVVADTEAAVRRIRAEVDPERGLVRFGFQHLMGTQLVPRVLRQLHDEHPAIRVDLVEGGAHMLAGQVADGEIDLGLVALPAPVERPHVTSEVLGEQELVLVVPAEHRLAGADAPVPLTAIQGEPLVRMADGYGMRTITEALVAEVGVDVEPSYECRDLATASGLVAAGLGVTVAPRGAGGPGTVEVALDVAGRTPTRAVQLLWHEAALDAAPVRLLRRSVEDVLPALLGPVSSGVPPASP
ncbi:LysR family transcriptional regulator [Nocardioides iriomotensis]|nr:LysR family transcriptional regulator [Nocardioides iriomotensis]